MSVEKAEISAGKYKLHALEIINFAGEVVDVSFLMDKLEVVESIDRLFATYTFTIVDGRNILEDYVFSGNEKIKLVILKKDSPGGGFKTLEKELVITGVKDFSRPSNEAQVWKMTATGEAAFASTCKRVSRSYKGVYLTDIIGSLFSEIQHKDGLSIEDNSAEGNFKMVLPNYTVNYLIRMLLNKAQKINGTPFYFFETLWEKHKLNSYENMVAKGPVDTYKLLTRDSTKQITEENFDKNRTRIRSIDSNIGASHFEGIATGAYFSRTQQLDYATKEYVYNDYSILAEGPSLPKLDKDHILDPGFTISNKALSDYKDARQYYISQNTLAFEEGVDNLHNRYEPSVGKKGMIVNNQYSITHNVLLHGDTRLYCGETLELDIPPATDPEDIAEITRDDLLSGKFLITAVVHIFDKEGNYGQRVSVRKDAINFALLQAKY